MMKVLEEMFCHRSGQLFIDVVPVLLKWVRAYFQTIFTSWLTKPAVILEICTAEHLYSCMLMLKYYNSSIRIHWYITRKIYHDQGVFTPGISH